MSARRGSTGIVVVVLAVLSCVPRIDGAPCGSDDDCPSGQRCISELCGFGERVVLADAGVTLGDAGVGGGDAGTVSDGGTMLETDCANGLDDDGDQQVDCADLDCNALTCRGAAGDCDLSEQCVGGVCPTDLLKTASTECRPSASRCDVAESCTGTNAECPSDRFADPSVQCRAASDAGCDLAEFCTGASSTCPADAVRPLGFVCRGDAGVCDVAELCDGTSTACPAEAFLPASTTCRPAAGPCDAPDQCPGNGVDCTLDVRLAANVACRLSGGSCDTVEFCPGDGGVDCPTDVNGCNGLQYCTAGGCAPKKANGVGCANGTECTSTFCADGVCCESSCVGACRSCNATPGQCLPAAANTDPQGECGAYQCAGDGGCATSCTGACSAACKASSYCSSAGACVPGQPNGQACTNLCECASGACTTFYVDGDGDGHGTMTSSTFCGTTAPVGYARDGGDCCDSDALTFPGQMTTFTTPRNASCGATSFDYNCDGITTPAITAVNACAVICNGMAASCSGVVAGWTLPMLPSCGSTATYASACALQTNSQCGGPTQLTCRPMFTNQVTQGCR